MKPKTEDDNENKAKFSRPQIAATVNHYLPGDKIMFEFLGDGIGAEFYAKELKNLSHISLCERDRKKRDLFGSSGRYLKLEVKHKVMFSDAIGCFELSKDFEIYNFLNLDFCTFFYDNGKLNSTAGIINYVFSNNIMSDNGIIAFTFQTKGLGVNLSKVAIRDKDEIFSAIRCLAEKNDVNVEEIYSYLYRSNKQTTMLNLIIRVNKIKATNDK